MCKIRPDKELHLFPTSHDGVGRRCLHLVDVFDAFLAARATLEATFLSLKVGFCAPVAERVAEAREEKRSALAVAERL
jgi:hypothetical protein